MNDFMTFEEEDDEHDEEREDKNTSFDPSKSSGFAQNHLQSVQISMQNRSVTLGQGAG